MLNAQASSTVADLLVRLEIEMALGRRLDLDYNAACARVTTLDQALYGCRAGETAWLQATRVVAIRNRDAWLLATKLQQAKLTELKARWISEYGLFLSQVNSQ